MWFHGEMRISIKLPLLSVVTTLSQKFTSVSHRRIYGCIHKHEKKAVKMNTQVKLLV